MTALKIESNNEKLLTFGQLLRLKREKIKLTITQVESEIRIVGSLSKYENDKIYPTRKNLAKLVKYYRLSEQEISNCRPLNNRAYTPRSGSNLVNIQAEKEPSRLTKIMSLLESVLIDADKLNGTGLLAASIKKETTEALETCKGLIQDILIVERLL